MKIKYSAEQITLDSFQKCDLPEEVSATFDLDVDLNDDAVDLATRDLILFVVIMWKKIQVFEEVRESPVEWDAFEGTFACEVEATNSRTHFKEYPEVFQNSWLYPSSSCTSWC